ncbi:retrovirus-related pol polyprotein from transposon TNT 1-94 [Tanacetum coccineum]
MTESPLVDSSFAIPVFSPRDDPIACLNKAMAFLTTIASSRFPSTNNKLRTSSNLRNQTTIQDGRKTRQVDRQGLLNATTVNVKDIWLGNALSLKDQGMQHDLGVLDGQVVQTIIPNNVSFQTEDLDTYDSDCDDISNAKAVLMSNISNYGSGVISEEKLALKEQVDSLEQNLSKQIKEKECFLQTFTIFKRESKENKDKYMEKKIDLEKKIKELDNIIFKVGQSAQTMHMLTKPQAFYVNIHKQALGPLYFLENKSQSKILSEDFRKCFTPQQEMDAELAFWFRIYNPTIESNPPPVKVEVPSELPKVSLVNASLKKLKFHLAQFDSMVKKRTTPDARTEASRQRHYHLPAGTFTLPVGTTYLLVVTIYYNIPNQTKNVELENSVAKLLSENERLCNEINHVKHVFKEQFDSIKKTRVHTKEQSDSLIDKLNLKSAENEDLKAQIQDKVFVITSLKNDLRKVKGKEIVDIAAQIPSANTIVPGMFKLDLEPLAPRLLQNREAHIDYLKYTQEQADILREIVEQAKVKQPLDKELDFACKHAQRIQELLVYVRDICPNEINLSAKKVDVTPKNKVKKVRFTEPLTSSSNIKQVESSTISDYNTPVLSPTGLKCSTSNCGSKPTGNKKNDRISRTPSRNMKNKLKANSELICATCKKSMFDGVHDMCILDFVENVTSRAKSAKNIKKQNIWKPTGHVFTEVGLKWKPTSRTFTIVGNSCPLTRITLANVVPPKKTTSHSVKTQKLELKVYNKKPKNVKNVGLSKKAKIVESKNANHSEPNHTWGSNATNIPSSSYLVMTGCPDCSLVSGLRMSKDEAPEAIIKCIKNIQVRLNATVRNVRTDNGTEFVNQTLREFYENVGISHQTPVARTP